MGQINQYAAEKPYLYHLSLWILCACTFALGIGFGYAHEAIVISIALVMLPACFVLTGSKKITSFLPVLFLVGYTNLAYQRAQHARIVAAIENKTLNIQAYIESIEPVQHALYRYLITAHADKTQDSQTNTTIDASWRMQCYTNMLPAFEIGDTVSFERITISKTRGSSFYNYLIKEQIHATAFLKTNNYEVITHPSFHAQRSLARYRYEILKRIRAKCSRNTYTLIASIFFGNRNCVKHEYKKIKEYFHHWGIMHFLARSGLHLVLFVLLLQLLLQLLPVPLILKHILIALATSVYAIFSWSSISFARACATFSWYTVCRIAGFQINVAHIVLLLSCLFLLSNPFLLFALDFQLSFGLTLILSLANQLGSAQK